MFTAVDGVGPDRGPVRDYSMANCVYFISFVMLGKLFLINLFTGVIIDTCGPRRPPLRCAGRSSRLHFHAPQQPT